MARRVIAISIENDELYKRLKRATKVLGKSRSKVIKYLLDRYLPKDEKDLEEFIEDYTKWEMEKAKEKIKRETKVIPVETEEFPKRNIENTEKNEAD